jgi:hypothetical protein
MQRFDASLREYQRARSGVPDSGKPVHLKIIDFGVPSSDGRYRLIGLTEVFPIIETFMV